MEVICASTESTLAQSVARFYLHSSLLRKTEGAGFNPLGKQPRGIINLWQYRRLIDRTQFSHNHFDSDVSLINWPQNDYMRGNLCGVLDVEKQEHIQGANQLSLSLLNWLQTEAPQADGVGGWSWLEAPLECRGDAGWPG